MQENDVIIGRLKKLSTNTFCLRRTTFFLVTIQFQNIDKPSTYKVPGLCTT